MTKQVLNRSCKWFSFSELMIIGFPVLTSRTHHVVILFLQITTSLQDKEKDDAYYGEHSFHDAKVI